MWKIRGAKPHKSSFLATYGHICILKSILGSLGKFVHSWKWPTRYGGIFPLRIHPSRNEPIPQRINCWFSRWAQQNPPGINWWLKWVWYDKSMGCRKFLNESGPWSACAADGVDASSSWHPSRKRCWGWRFHLGMRIFMFVLNFSRKGIYRHRHKYKYKDITRIFFNHVLTDTTNINT